MLTNLDWIVLCLCLGGLIALGLWMGRRAKANLEGFFLGGRNLPFWLAGLSMVATTFAADTPLAVTELVAEHGIAGNWLWWNLLAGGMLTAVLFAPLWRRAGVVTEAEFIELRYQGAAAKWLRVFRAGYLGLFINLLIMGWVHLAMMTVLEGIFGITSGQAMWIALGVTLAVAAYAMVSGLLGIVVTDAVQFILAMVGSIALAVFVIGDDSIGGLSGLREALPEASVNFFPAVGEGGEGSSYGLPLASFIAFLGMMWWSAWYPGAEPGGGGYVAQRVLSTKSEKDATGSTLLFNFAHYAIRPWPWILVALAASVLFALPPKLSPEMAQALETVQQYEGYEPSWITGDSSPDNIVEAANVMAVREGLRYAAMEDPDLAMAIQYHAQPRYGYIHAMRMFLPSGWLGLMLVAFFSAYMSTLSTQLNWGASYLVNDIWLRLRKGKPKDSQVMITSRVTVLILAGLSLAISTQMDNIAAVWQFIMECGAGLGLVLILRWFWGRINAWVEITATIAPFIGYALAHYGMNWVFPNSFFFTVGFTTAAWLLVMMLTPASGAWPAFREKIFGDRKLRPVIILMRWLLAVICAYSMLFTIGSWLLHTGNTPWIYTTVTVVTGVTLIWSFKQSQYAD